jgi:vacuolar-type H+-ATPase subunit E/Vma4
LPGLDDLNGFEEALLAQHRERCLVLKRSVDEDLADIITMRRLEVERIVHNLRCSRKKRFDEGVKANRRRVELQKKTFKIGLQDRLFERLEEKVRVRLEIFRRSSRYGDVMKALIAEVEGFFSSPSIVWVEEGDSVFLRSGGVLEVREGLKDVWGGLLIEEKESGRLVDNTFRTRWRRLRPFFIAEHGEVFAQSFE